MHLAIPERLGCTDILFKINKLSKIFICRLDKRRIGNNQPTTLPSWHLREPPVYKTPRTSEPPAPESARGAHAHRPCLEREQWERREGASPAPRAPQLPSRDPRSTPRAPSAPRAPPAPAPELRGAAHLRRRGPRTALTKQGQGHGKGARRRLAAARQSTRCSQAARRSPHPPAALTPRRESGVGGAWRTPARREAAGRDAGGRCKKKLFTRYCRTPPAQGRPASPRRAGTCRCHLCTSGARAGGTCQAGRLGRGEGPAGRRRRGGRRRGERSSLAEPPAGRAHSASRGLAVAILR